MGLTVRIKGYVGAYDCGYITYGNFIMQLIKKAYGQRCCEIFLHSLISGKPFSEAEETFWNSHCNEDLDLWIWRSDCDGKFTPAECRRIYNSIKGIQMDFVGHNYGDTQSYNMLDRWKDMFLYCAKKRVNMYFA